MFDHLEADDQVERLAGHHLHPAGAIIDGEPARLGMGAGRADVLGRRVHACHGRAEPRQGLCQQPSAAAHVKRALAGERREPRGITAKMPIHHLAQIGQARRVQPVEHRR
jgi:hypothetical protein